VASPLCAQRGDIDHRFSLFIDGATASGGVGVADNLGGGASLDLRALATVSVRLTGSYNRVAAGTRVEPNQYLSGSADVVYYPLTETLVRPYAFGGVGYSRQAQRSSSIVTQGATITQTTPAYYFLGASAGLGVELGGLFIQYRIPPKPTNANASSRYELISLGVRF
jgi:hypothetical protein